ncbi:hypothetical protein KKD52_07570 [Myxococcota bacterium]|nr:hypothetical protein [Myxococcota bacterium]MBU1510206.1 hypothetical protein [Myxococcota bacterium]
MLRRVHLFSLAFAMLWISACGPKKQEDPGWLPRTESAAAIRRYHNALAILARTSPSEACRLGFFGIGELILAAQDLPPGHQAQLFGNFGIACDNPRVNPDCAVRLFEALHEAFASCAAVSPETAEWGRRFLRWQGQLKESWDREHFEEAVALLGSPMERLTRLTLLGAYLHALSLLPDKPAHERTWQFVRWLGFPCPAWAASFSTAGPEDNPDAWPPYCLPSCPEAKITEPLADFTLRARRLAAACPPSAVGLTRVEDYRYYTLDNHLVFRTAAFLRQLLADTRRDPHPLSVWHWEKLARADVAWERLELTLFPSLPLDDGADTDVPSYSKAAVENIVWPVIRMDPFGAAEAEGPSVFFPATGEIRPGAHEAIDAGGSFLTTARRVAARSGDFTIALSGRASSDQVLLLGQQLRAGGHTRLRFLFRNASQVLRACTVDLAGPPPVPHDILLTFGPDELTLSSGAGPLAGNPFIAAGAYDFSGLRQKLEGIRHRIPRAAVVHVTLRSGVALTTIAKMLGYVMRNSSGRTLFGTIRLTVGEAPAPPAP